MSIADPLPAGGRPLPLSDAELSAHWNKWREGEPTAPLSGELHLRAEEFDRQHIKAAKYRAWKTALAEAAYIKQHGPRSPFPRLADQTEDGGEYWAKASDRPEYRRGAVTEDLGDKRESDFVEHCLNTAGHIMPADKFAESVKRRFVRFDQSTRLAMALVEGGARKAESRKNAPSILTLISRQETKLPIIPRVNFLPETAAGRRSPMLKEVEAYAARFPLARMATFTGGQRQPITAIRSATATLTRKISRLNAEDWFRARCTIPFRAVEFGTFKLCPRTCEWTVHVHAHTIFHPLRHTKRKKWAVFCKKVSAFMGAHWDGGKPIENAREFVKYPVKPADLEALLHLGGTAPICEFYRQTKGMRLVETLGKLRRQRASIRNTKRKRLKEKTRDGEWIPTIRRDWNSHGRSKTKAAILAKRQQQKKTREFRESMDTLQGFCRIDESPAAPKMVNRIVARLAPAPFASAVYEPAVFVWNFDGDWNAITTHKCVARAVEAVRPQVEDAMRRAARSPAAGGHNRSHQSHNCPEVKPELGLLNAPPDPFRRHLEAVST